ncbi:uncharacterized protein LOC128864816 [Anastrepha ludens]|uniref:uncharacterized protein LOC128864816 n=1 Tax=Anastrepha ludens TaxID=28586 RepID=UPI0023B052D6|nr:uncharacterized protein LOC128864816 [Anastrepha ludens]
MQQQQNMFPMNVLAPHFCEDLRADIGDAKFSLIVDESTGIAITKLLGVVINYYSISRSLVVSTFLSIVEIDSGDSICISEALLKELNKWKLDAKNVIGIGTDNASVMVGSHKSVYVELKKHSPDLLLIKCVCHSVQLAVNYACKQFMPEDLEYLIYETYNWFSKSSHRQSAYRQIYELMNNDKTPLKIPRVCETRWLSIETAVSRVIDQWEELKLHFSIAAIDEKCTKAKMLQSMYNERINYLYLLFLRPILKDMQRVNQSFQSKKPDSTKLLKDLLIAIKSLKHTIISPDDDINVLNSDFESYVKRDLYLGYAFEKELKTLSLDRTEESQVRIKCTDFCIELIHQLKKRIPDNFEVLNKIDLFSVGNVLRAKKESIIELLIFFKVEDVDNLKRQYDNLQYNTWQNVENTEKFWAEVYNYKDSTFTNPYKELASLALKILSLPWSNAEVERLFSQVNLIKTKLRNRMNCTVLSSILAIRYGLRRQGKCCFDYDVPTKCLRKANYKSDEGVENDELVFIDEIITTLN